MFILFLWKFGCSSQLMIFAFRFFSSWLIIELHINLKNDNWKTVNWMIHKSKMIHKRLNSSNLQTKCVKKNLRYTSFIKVKLKNKMIRRTLTNLENIKIILRWLIIPISWWEGTVSWKKKWKKSACLKWIMKFWILIVRKINFNLLWYSVIF